MKRKHCLLIEHIGMVTPVGLTSAASAAAIRAGIARFKEIPLMNTRGQPIVMALLSDKYLPKLKIDNPWFKTLPFSKRERVARMIRLGGIALSECAQENLDCASIPILLALPEGPSFMELRDSPHFLNSLASQSGVVFDVARSQVVQRGRAGGFMMLQEAMKLMLAQPDRQVFVGGIDTYLDLDLLHALEKEGRLRIEGGVDGFIPGEAAAFLLCSSTGSRIRLRSTPLANIDAVGIGEEPAHRYTSHPCLGHGLTAALGALWTAASAEGIPVQSVLMGFTGERDQANEWGVAMIRHRSRFAETLALTHPADCVGDVGAAMGPLLIGLGAIGLQRGYRIPPCVVGCTSDRELRGAALLSAL